MIQIERFVGLYVIDEQNDTPILRVEKCFTSEVWDEIY